MGRWKALLRTICAHGCAIVTILCTTTPHRRKFEPRCFFLVLCFPLQNCRKISTVNLEPSISLPSDSSNDCQETLFEIVASSICVDWKCLAKLTILAVNASMSVKYLDSGVFDRRHEVPLQIGPAICYEIHRVRGYFQKLWQTVFWTLECTTILSPFVRVAQAALVQSNDFSVWASS